MVDWSGPNRASPALTRRTPTLQVGRTLLAAVAVTMLVAMPVDASFALVGYVSFYTSPDGQTWDSSVSEDWAWFRSLTYGGGQWLAGTEWSGGLIYTSPNGIDWTPQATGASGTITGIAYGTPNSGPMYVAVGPSIQSCLYTCTNVAEVYTSPNGVAWTAVQTPYTTQSWDSPLRGVTFGPSSAPQPLFVAVGEDSTILTSVDGTAWAMQTSGAVGSAPILHAVANGNGRFVAVGDSGTIRTSTNGVVWTTPTSPTTATLYGVAWGNGQWMAVGDYSTILTSPDGITWTSQSAGTYYSAPLRSVGYGGGRWVAVSNWMFPSPNSLSAYVITSIDGITWEPRPATTYYYYGPGAIAYGAGLWVGVGPISIVRSSNGLDWISGHAYAGYFQPAVAYDGTQYVSVGYYGSAYTSPDGKEWTARGTGVDNSCWCKHFYGVAYGAGKWVAVGEGGIIITSPDGITWTEQVSGITQRLNAVAFRPGQWLAVGESGEMLTSLDGITWTQRSSGSSNSLRGAVYGDGNWTVTGSAGTIIASSDGMYWTARTSGTSTGLYGIAFDPSGSSTRWVAGGDGTVLSSADGQTWTSDSTGTWASYYAVARDSSQWVVGGWGDVSSSPSAASGSWSNHYIQNGAYGIASDVVPPLSCLPATQIVGVNQNATIGAGGGKWTYSWNAPGSNLVGPTPGANIVRSYNTPGNYSVTVTDSSSAQQSAECEVVVMLNPPPPPPPPPGPLPACGHTVTTSEDDPTLYQWEELDPAMGGTGTGMNMASPWWWWGNIDYFSAYAVTPSDMSATEFAFDFCGSTYTSFWLASAGHICLDNSDTATGTVEIAWWLPTLCGYYYPTPIPDSNWWVPKPAVYGLWGLQTPDICTDGNGNWGSTNCMFYEIQGTAPNRVLIYEQKDVPTYWDTSVLQSFEMKLFEASDCMEVHYRSAQSGPWWTWIPTAAGFQDAGGGQGYEHFFHQPGSTWAYSEEAWRSCPFGVVADTILVNEDQGAATHDVTLNDNGAGESIAVTSWTNTTKGTLVRGSGPGNFTYQPFAHATGPDSFNYTIQNPSGSKVSTGRATFEIQPVNDAPSFVLPATVLATPDQGARVIPGFAYNVTPGPAGATDEVTQAINFTVVSNSNAGIFLGEPVLERTLTATDVNPAVPNTSGAFAVLRFVPSGNAGTSEVCFAAVDSGGNDTVTNAWGDDATGVPQGAPTCFDIIEDAPPIAYFEPNSRNVAPGVPVVFNSCPGPVPHCTTDLDGSIVTYLWEFGDSSSSGLSSPSHVYATPGVYVVRLTVWDNHGVMATTTRTVTVAWPNGGPLSEDQSGSAAITADAGEDRIVLEGTTVQLAGAQEGATGGKVEFAWTQLSGPRVTLSDATTATPSFTAPDLSTMDPVDVVFGLRVSEGPVTSPSDYLVIHVISDNHVPVARAAPAEQAVPGQVVRLDATGSEDQDGDTLTYRWEQEHRPGEIVVTLSDATSTQPTFTTPPQAGLLHFRLTVSDGMASSQDQVTVDVRPQVSAADGLEQPGRSAEVAEPRADALVATRPSWVPIALGAAGFLLIALVVVALVARRFRA